MLALNWQYNYKLILVGLQHLNYKKTINEKK